MHRFFKTLFGTDAAARHAARAARPRLALDRLEAREVMSVDFIGGDPTHLGIFGDDAAVPGTGGGKNDEVVVRTVGNNLVVQLNPNNPANAGNPLVTQFNGTLGQITKLTIDAKTGANAVRIESALAGLTKGITVVNPAANNGLAVSLGSAGSVQGINAPVNVQNPRNLTVNNFADPTGRVVNITSAGITGLTPAPITYTWGAGPVRVLDVRTGNGADTVRVLSGPAADLTLTGNGGLDTYNVEAAAQPITINGGVGKDVVNIAPGSQSLNAIDAKVRVVDGAYADTVNVFDQNGGFAGRISYNAYLAADSVTRFEQRSVGTSPTGAPIVAVDAATVSLDKVQSVRFGATTKAGANGLHVTGSQPGTTTVIDGGLANTEFGTGSKLDGILGPVTVNRVLPGGLVTIVDSAQTTGKAYTLRANSVERAGIGKLSFDANSATVRLRTGSGNDIFSVPETRPAGVIDVDGGAGTDTLIAPNVNNLFRVTATNKGDLNGRVLFANVDSFQGGSKDDHFRLSNGAGVSGRFTGGAGFDTLDYALYGTAVDVNLGTGTATNVNGGLAGGLSGIDAVIGGAAGDKLTGGAGNEILVGRGGADTLVGGGGRDILIGGAGKDTLTGGNGQVVYIGGTTSFDTNPVALKNLHAEWSRLDADYTTRVTNLRNGGGLNGTTVLRPTGSILPGTVFGDGQADLITAGSDLDFFLRDAADTFAGFNLPGQTVNGVTEVTVNLP
jgi:hypothetical protein